MASNCNNIVAPSESGGSITCAEFDVNILEQKEMCQEIQTILAGFGLKEATLTADTTTMFITYVGENAPTLVEGAAGEYTLTEPAGTIIRGFYWDGDEVDTDGVGDIQLSVVSTDGQGRFMMIQIIDRGNNQVVENPSAFGILINQVESPVGTVIMTMTSMDAFGANGFKVMAKVA